MASTFQSLLSELQNVKPKVTIPTKKKVTAQTLSDISAYATQSQNLSGALGKAYAQTLPTAEKTRIAAETSNAMASAPSQYGFFEGFSPVSPMKQLESTLGQKIDTEATKQTLPYKTGAGVGMAAQFAIPYAAAGKTVSTAVKAAPLVAKLGKTGQAIAGSVGADLAIGLPLNVAYAAKEGLQGKEAAKSIGINTAIDLVTGGLLEIVPIILKSGKKIASKTEFENSTPDEQAEVAEEIIKRYTASQRPLKKINVPVVVEKTIETPKENYAKIEKEALSNISSILGKTPRKDKESVTNLVSAFRKNELGFNELADGILSAVKNIPYSTSANAETVSDIKKYIKSGIKITDDLRQIQDFKQFRVEHAGKVKFSPNGVTVDKIYSELHDAYGNLFPDSITNQVDQLEQIIKVIGKSNDSVKLGDVANDNDLYNIYLEPIIKELEDLSEASKYTKRINSTIPTGKSYPISKSRFNTPMLGRNRPVEQSLTQKQGIVPSAKAEPQIESFKDLGADIARPTKTNEELIAQYGTEARKMQPQARVGVLPSVTDFGEVQKGAISISEARAVNDETLTEIQNAVAEGMATKYGTTNQKALDQAEQILAESGNLDVAYGKFKSVLDDEKQIKPKDIALGYRLLQKYQETGQNAIAADVAMDVSEMLSKVGQSLQASQILKRLSPEGRLVSVQRLAKKLSDKYGVDVKLDDETVNALLTAKTEKEIAESMHNAGTKLWDQIPANVITKLDAYRYISMLLNPKTHVRNIIGNAIFVPVREMKNVYGVALEKAFVKEGERTKAILNPVKDKAYIDLGNKDFDEVKPILMNEGKLDDQARKLEAVVFKNKAGEAIRQFSMNALNKEDGIFMRRAYRSSFAQYLKANKINIAKEIDFKTLEKARAYAANEALKATYRDFSSVASAISRAKTSLKYSKSGSAGTDIAKRVGGMALEGLFPFTKTPINILKRGIEYSPVSLLTASADLVRIAKNGGNVAKALDKMAAGLSGSSIMLLGMLFAHKGIINGGSDYDYSSKQYQSENMKGMQEYSINLPDGGTYTLDWAAPASMPFFVGVELAKSFGEGNGDLSKVVDAITSIDEPIFNMSMLKGINDALKSWKTEGALGDVAMNMGLSYLSQFVPTAAGQIARTADDTRRAYISTAESGTQRKLEKFVQKQIGKIPVAAETNQPYIDLWGRTETSGTALENFLSPGYYRSKNVTSADKAIETLAKKVDAESATDIIPRPSTKYTITQDGTEYRMTPAEFTKFKTTRGKASLNGINKLISSDKYGQMTNDEKVKAIKTIYDDAFDAAKKEFLSSKGVSVEEKVTNKAFADWLKQNQ